MDFMLVLDASKTYIQAYIIVYASWKKNKKPK